MARGEPPGRQFIKSRPTASTYRPSMARQYPSSSMPTFGPGGGIGASQARLQEQVDQIMPSTLSRSEQLRRDAEEIFGFLTEQDTIDAVKRGDISPALGAAIIAAGVVPLPVGKTAGLVAKGTSKVASKVKPPVKPQRMIDAQRARDKNKIAQALLQSGRARTPERPAPAPQPTPPARFPEGRTPRTDDPRPQTALDTGGLPVAGEAVPTVTPAQARQAAKVPLKKSGDVDYDRFGGGGFTTPRQQAAYAETQRRLKETASPTRKEQAEKAFKDKRDSPEKRRQDAAQREVMAEEGVDPRLGARTESLMARTDLAASGNRTEVVSGRTGGAMTRSEADRAAAEAVARDRERLAGLQSEREELAEQGLKPSRNQKPLNPQTEAEVAYDAINPKPVKKDFPGKGQKARYEEALAKWNEGREEFVQRRMDDLATRPSPTGDASEIPGFTPNVADSADYNPYAFLNRGPEPAKPAAKTPKGRKPKQKKEEKPVETPAETPEEIPIPKKSTVKKTTKKTTKKKTEKKTQKAKLPDYATGATNDKARKKPFGPAKPKDKAKDPQPKAEDVRSGGENPRSGGEKPRSFIPTQVAKDATRDNAAARGRAARNDMDPGTAEEARLRGMDAATRGVIKPKAKESTRAKQGYLKAEQEKAIKDRANEIYGARGPKPEKKRAGESDKDFAARVKNWEKSKHAGKKFAGMMVLGATGLAFPSATIVNQIMDENVKKVSEEGVAEAAEEAVAAEEKDQEPKSKEAKSVLRDKYGRKITREEFNRRKAYRKKLEGMSPAERKAARKKEMDRREKWRGSIGKQLFKKAATKATRNLDLKEGVSSREVNKLMREALGKQGDRGAAQKARRQFVRAS